VLLVWSDHAVVLLAELNADLVDEAQVRQVLELAVAIDTIPDEAALVNVHILDRCVFVGL